VPSSEILGRRAKAGEITFAEAARALVTRVHFEMGENVSETARKLEIDRRTVQRHVDQKRLARWRKQGGKK
jgi:ActR/RegA family two-component response regulator